METIRAIWSALRWQARNTGSFLLAWFAVLGSAASIFAAVSGILIYLDGNKKSDLYNFALTTTSAIIVVLLFSFLSLLAHLGQLARTREAHAENALLKAEQNYLRVMPHDMYEVQKTIEYLLTQLDRLQLDIENTTVPEALISLNADSPAAPNASSEVEIAGRYKQAQDKFLAELVERTRAIFETMIKERCAVCIKSIFELDGTENELRALDAGPGRVFVHTLLRDRESHHNRRGSNPAYYSVKDNTAFEQILDRKEPNNYFIENNLEALAQRNGYRNSNPNWRKFYNATLVAPVYVLNPDDGTERNAIGFLCVDTKRGIFNEDVHVSTLQILAKLASFASASNQNAMKWSDIRDQIRT